MRAPHVSPTPGSLVAAVCASVVLIAALVILGWLLNIPRLEGGVGSLPPMTMQTALGALFAAGSLWALREGTHRRVAFIAPVGAAITVMLGLAAALSVAWPEQSRLGVLRAGSTGEFDAGTTLGTSAMMAITGSALLLLWRRHVQSAQWSAVLVLLMGVFALEAWIYEALSLYDLPVFSPLAIPALACFVLLSIGVLDARSDQGVMAAFASNRPGGLMARRIWLPLLILVGMMGTLIEWFQYKNWLDARTDSLLIVVWIALLSTGLIWLNARSLNRLDETVRRTLEERRHVELSLTRQASLFDQAYEGMVMSQQDGAITFWNRGAEQLFGFERDEAVGRVAHDLLRTTIPGGIPLQDQLKRNRFWEGQLQHRHKDGHEVIVNSRMTLVEDEGGVFLVEAIRDISERVRTEIALRESERRFREIAEWLPQLVWTCEPDGWCDFLSQRWLHFTGSTLAKEVGYGWLNQIHPHDQPELMTRWRASVEHGTDFRTEFRIRRHDGVYRWFDTRALPLRDENGAIVKWFGSNTDIEDERAIREALRSNEERLQLALEINETAAWDLDVVRGVVHRSIEHDRIFGYDTLQPEWTFESFVRHVVPEDRDRIRRRFAKTFTSPVNDWSFDCQVTRCDGDRRWIAVRGRSRRGPAGDIQTLSGVVQDVTARKQIEEEILQLNTDLEGRVEQRTQALEAANRELEAFSYSVSHDLRAPLRTIDGFSQAVLEDFGPELPVEGQRYLKIIREGAQRMGRLIDDLLAFSRLSRLPLNTRAVDMHALARESWQEVIGSNGQGSVEMSIDALPACSGDPSLLKQVWLNLLSNALKYSRDSAPPRVHIGHADDEQRQVFFVRDNGTGFDMQYAHKLFRVFQRLHRSDEFEGTGVGLAVVQRIIHRHGGRIWADAEVGRGATFYFTLDPEGSRESQPPR